MDCRICEYQAKYIFSKLIFGKYDVRFYKCPKCNFLQTEEPFWLAEAYKSGAISALDTGVISRNIDLSYKTKEILLKVFENFKHIKGLDYGGGEGITVRLLRDHGFNFYRYDLYAENLYAKFFDITDLQEDVEFDILTAFEVFEHLVNPIEEIEKMFNYSNVILFSTELQPPDSKNKLENWWYLVPEGGQHISFYDRTTMPILAQKFNAVYYTNGQNLHILSKNKDLINPFENEDLNHADSRSFFNKLFRKVKLWDKIAEVDDSRDLPSSLISKDFEMVKNKINKDEY